MKKQIILIISIILMTNLAIIASQEPDPSLKETGLLPGLQQIVIDYTGHDNWTQSKILLGHTSKVNSISISGDGSTLVSGSDDGTVKIWDINSGRCTFTLGNFDKLFFSPAPLDKLICDYINQEPILDAGNNYQVNYVALSNDKRYICFLLSNQFIYVYDTIKNSYVLKNISLEVDIQEARKQYIKQDKEAIEDEIKKTQSNDDRIFLTNCLKNYDKYATEATLSTKYISTSLDNKYLIYKNYNFEKIWNIENNICLRTIYNGKYAEELADLMDLNISTWDFRLRICVSSGGVLAYTKANTKLIANLNCSSWREGKILIDTDLYRRDAFNLETGDMESIKSLVLSPDGKYLAVAADNVIRIWSNNIQRLLY